jgi:hypothetical protein
MGDGLGGPAVRGEQGSPTRERVRRSGLVGSVCRPACPVGGESDRFR